MESYNLLKITLRRKERNITYFLKHDPQRGGKTHIFDENRCSCDDLEHDEWKFIQQGIKLSLVSCENCMKKLASIVEKEMREILDGL